MARFKAQLRVDISRFVVYRSQFIVHCVFNSQSMVQNPQIFTHRLRLTVYVSQLTLHPSVSTSQTSCSQCTISNTQITSWSICKFPIHKSPIRDTDEDTKKYPVPKIIIFTAFPTSTVSIEDIGPPIAHSKTAVQTVDIDCLQPKRTSTSHCTSSQCTAYNHMHVQCKLTATNWHKLVTTAAKSKTTKSNLMPYNANMSLE